MPHQHGCSGEQLFTSRPTVPHRLLPVAPHEQKQFSCCSQAFTTGLSGSTSGEMKSLFAKGSHGRRRVVRGSPQGEMELASPSGGSCPIPCTHEASQRELVPGSSQFIPPQASLPWGSILLLLFSSAAPEPEKRALGGPLCSPQPLQTSSPHLTSSAPRGPQPLPAQG